LVRFPVMQQQWLSYATPYAIGGVAMFWVIERIAAFF
jgi:hypothetical protein